MGYTIDSTPISVGGSSAFANVQNAWAGIIDAYDNPNSKNNLQRDAIQQSLIDQENLAEQDMYSKINTLPSTPHTTLDKNIQNFFMNKIDKGYEYEMLRKQGQISSRDANLMLSGIHDDMNLYTELAPLMVAQATIMKESIKNGTISRANSDPMQMMFMGIANNQGNIRLEEDEGGMYLVGKGEINGNPWEGKINIKEIQRYLSTEGAQIARTIPTSEDMGLGTIFDTLKKDGKLNAFLVDKDVPDPDRPGYYRTVKEFTKESTADLYDHLMANNNLFENLMRSDMAPSAWTDIANANLSTEELNGTIGATMMVKNEFGDYVEVPNPLAGKKGWGVWDPNDKEKVEYLRGKLVDRMLAEKLPTALISEAKADPYAVARYEASLKGPMANWSAGAKDNYAYFQKITEAVKSGDLSKLTEMKEDVKVIKQPGGKWAIVKLKRNNRGAWVEDKVYSKGLSIDDPRMAEELFDVFGVTKYLPQYGVDVRQLAGDHSWNWGEEFAGIGEEIRQYNMENPDASLEDILKLEYGKGDNKITIVDRINSDLVPGVTIDDNEIVYEGPNADMKKKFDGKDLTKDLLVDLMNWINRTGLVQKRSDAYHTSRTAIDNLNKFRSTSKN